ncbi:hypothetical protein BDP55DRAFT_720679 [Colletotrichum godetiae]|uniref:Uncharacterized protein n=1 Tax=Colletotrichum godetiae TaxID=1209918 RepID=A0AAJ0A8B0_9PEZI|nr:uncharacterized protein BDP55DRAFT_720679 [Colletotrichum godetiae]KAK1658363.1 hypothetical protein BDP55DRAFT_720679 [Colletotrichum godetiae]
MPNALRTGPSQPPQTPDQTPRHLYRVFDTNSKGQTSETQVSSEHSSVLTLPGRNRGWTGFLEKDDYQGIRATRLVQHLNWEVVPPYGSGLGTIKLGPSTRKAPFPRLVNDGLFDIFPHLNPESVEDGLANRVVELRNEVEGKIRKALTLGVTCFGPKLSGPFAAMLLSMLDYPSRLSAEAMTTFLTLYSQPTHFLVEPVEVPAEGPWGVYRYHGFVKEIMMYEKAGEAKREAVKQKTAELPEQVDYVRISRNLTVYARCPPGPVNQ